MLPNLWRGRLQLQFICDVEDLETATLVTEPFLQTTHSSEPLLAACSIRLGRKRDSDVSKLARRAVSLLTEGVDPGTEDSNATSFRFMDLPTELRLQILSHTDLVAPRQEVEWNPESGGYYIRYLDSEYHLDSDWTTPGIEKTYMPCWFRSCLRGCFCGAQHAAYTSKVPCHDWIKPTSMFLVNRGFCADARRVFYSENRFVITPNAAPWVDADAVDRLPASVFLTDVMPRNCLRYLRSLEFVFPSLGKIITYC